MRTNYVAGGLIALLSSCGALPQQCAPTLPAPPSYPYVALGDSVLMQAREALQAQLPDAFIDAVPGRGPDGNVVGDDTLRRAVDANAALVRPGGWLIVEEAGDHDVTVEFAQHVADVLGDDRNLAWIVPFHPTDVDRNAVSLANIQQGTQAQPGVRLIRWDQVDKAGLTEPDGLHLNGAGVQVFAEFVKNGVS